MVRIVDLDWGEEREEHIARHGVSPEEVEEACFGLQLAVRIGRNRYRLIGQTTAGRYLTVFLDQVGPAGWFIPITARPATAPEVRMFRRQKGT